MLRPQSSRQTRHAPSAMGPVRLIAFAGLLCWIWLSQNHLLAQQYQQRAPMSMPPANSGQPAMLSNPQLSATNLNVPQPLPGSQPGVAGEFTDAAAAADDPKIPMTSLFGAIREGGFMMFPIIACSFGLTVFVFERLLFLRRNRVIPRSFVRGVIEQLEQQQLDRDEAIALCEENGSPIAQLFQAALKRYGRQSVEIEQAVLDAGERVTTSLRSYLRLFSTISNVTPLLGLLGTVLGMIEAFNAIAATGAMGRPELLAGGIGQALLTTAAGLFVAIPAYTAYAYFLARADKLTIEMDTHVQRVIELVSAEGLQESGRSRSRSRRAAA